MSRSKLILGFAAVLGIFFLLKTWQGQFTIPAGLSFGFFSLRFYSLSFLVAAVVAWLTVGHIGKNFAVENRHLENLVVINVLAGLVGARIHHVLSQLTYYEQHVTQIWQVWRGGLGFFGGFILATIVSYLYVRANNLNFFKVADVFSIPLLLAQAIGRWGNFFNQEAYGLPTDLPWKIFISVEHRLPDFLSKAFFHPLFLYESLWNLGAAAYLYGDYKRNSPVTPGAIFCKYLILYSLGRFLMENLRTDKTLVWGVAANQLLSLVILSCGLTLFYSVYHRHFTLDNKKKNW